MKKLVLLMPLLIITATQSIPSKKKSHSWKEEKKQQVQKALSYIHATRSKPDTVQATLKDIETAAATLITHLRSTEQQNPQNVLAFTKAINDLIHYTQLYRLQSGNSLIPPLPADLCNLMPPETKD